MAFSGSIGVTQFNANVVVDHAYRRCRLPAQAITAEMQQYAIQSLQFMLYEFSNTRTPSWCIEKIILPMYENRQIVPLPIGTVEVLNLNYRQLNALTGTETVAASTYTMEFEEATKVSTVGILWDGTANPLTFEVSEDGLAWTTVGTETPDAAAGEISWYDITGALAFLFFRVTATGLLNAETVTLGNNPQEIPMGQLNRDQYADQNNQIFPGRPTTYWFQRNIEQPVVNLWPAPNAAAMAHQLILWRHRYIMDQQNLRQQIEIPNRWFEAIINGLAARVAAETPMVDMNLIPMLEQKAAASLASAWQGDNDGSPTQINPGIGVYTA